MQIYHQAANEFQQLKGAEQRSGGEKKIHKIILYFGSLRSGRLLSTDKMNAT
jgi:hypothetical protein